MAERTTSLLDLPLDILFLIFPYLDAKSFLSLCATCKILHQPSIRFESSYWCQATRNTFRVPNQPVVQHDGQRWQKMYRRLLTQSRVFTWGQHSGNRLGHRVHRTLPEGSQLRFNPMLARRRLHQVQHCPFPGEMEDTQNLGVIADMQCGGWSTTLLTSKGQLCSVGIMDGQRFGGGTNGGPKPLIYPPGFPQAETQYHDPSTAICQFSSGRSHILGLSDSGRIWSWYSLLEPALHVKFMNVETREISSEDKAHPNLYGRVQKVIAGWAVSSAYISGVGIVLWSPVERDHDERGSGVDSMLVMESVEVPRTGYRRSRGSQRESEEEVALGKDVGEVVNYIVLEGFVVFVTDIGKVFASKIGGELRFGDPNNTAEIMELCALRNDSGSALDVQGAFRSFAIFQNGEVITSRQEYLEECWAARLTNPEQKGIGGLSRIPALQHNDVIQLSFGDYHFLALHSTGKITSYGKELQNCGALGLGGDDDFDACLRGVRYNDFRREASLVPHAYTQGRQVWFEPEKRKWIRFMASGGRDPEEAKARIDMLNAESSVQGEVSEWFEQEGRNWDKDAALKDADEDGLGACFALSICAAGWHSGALVLVNEELTTRVREKCIVKDTSFEAEDSTARPEGQAHQQLHLQQALNEQNHGTHPRLGSASPGKGFKYVWADRSFPRLRLSDGREMPGEVEFDEWKFGRPEWQLDVDV
ncbi:hypothetical protein GQ43DRAFT_444587 [Delitschia confertaspora ATCC 74209]|uniref:F-box domain-containing protein n=1 Tax=Delitschia confertaspora ATCC 74209 TaxID=1513339 RepID=A0A9P4JDA4_9PLEO|nr:hypothetical protein GQ43DRAFT_444587 [Delitschia confertaspora ATCC 74209]